MRRNRAFALLEVLTALAVWALVIVVGGRLLGETVRMQRSAEQRLSRLLACRNTLETACLRSGSPGDTVWALTPAIAFAVADSVQLGMVRVRAFSPPAGVAGDPAAVFTRAVWRGGRG